MLLLYRRKVKKLVTKIYQIVPILEKVFDPQFNWIQA